LQLEEAKLLAQEAWEKFRHLPPDSVEIRLLTEFIRKWGDCREKVEDQTPVERIKSSPTMAEIDAAIGAVCSIGGG